ncbi:MAG TPA: SEC-C metal-binding domain-containing protein, partial [Nitrospirota bacterium]
YEISNGIDFIINKTKEDRENHDFTIAVGAANSGLTIHCTNLCSNSLLYSLRTHCLIRKYKQKATRWFGLIIDTSLNLQGGLVLDYSWEQSQELDEMTMGLPAITLNEALGTKKKIGRNDPCKCGSGKKFKKCCENK